VVHEFLDILNRFHILDLDDAQACGELPEVSPVPGEHARTDGFLRR
jgi:hypothetical protein